MGTYVGEVIRCTIGGEWSADATIRGLGGDVGEVNPLGKARKRFTNGPQESLAWFYEIVRQHASG